MHLTEWHKQCQELIVIFCNYALATDGKGFGDGPAVSRENANRRGPKPTPSDSRVTVEREALDGLLARALLPDGHVAPQRPAQLQGIALDGVVAGEPAPGRPMAVHKSAFFHGGQSNERGTGCVRSKGDADAEASRKVFVRPGRNENSRRAARGF